MASPSASALNAEELARIQEILDAFPIEVAELTASPKQLRFQQAFFDRVDPDTGRRLKVFAAVGANRSGKSILAGGMCFCKYLRDRAADGDVFWCVSPTLDRSVGGVQKELWRFLPRWMFAGASRGEHGWAGLPQVWDEKIGFGAHRKVVLQTHDGGRCLVEFRSNDQNPTTFEQAKLRGIWADERIDEAIFDRLIPRLVDQDGFLLYSDIPEQWWQFERLKEALPEAGVFFMHLVMSDNAHNLPAGAIEAAAALMTADEQKLRIAGEFVVMEGVVYKEFVDKPRAQGGHLVRRGEVRVPPEWPRWRLIDYGGSAPTAALWAAVAPNEHVYLYREHYERGLNVVRNAKMMCDASAGERYRQTLIDPHAFDKPPAYYGPSPSVADQYAAGGVEAVGWPFVQVMGEHALVQRVKFRLENRTVWVFEDLVNLRRELRSWKYQLDKDGKPLAKDAFEADNNHLLDCLKGFLATDPCFTQLEARVEDEEELRNGRAGEAGGEHAAA